MSEIVSLLYKTQSSSDADQTKEVFGSEENKGKITDLKALPAS